MGARLTDSGYERASRGIATPSHKTAAARRPDVRLPPARVASHSVV